MGLAIGIDLGTTNTVIAAVAGNTAVTLADEHGRRLLPSIVSFHPSGKVLVGELARERRMVDGPNTIYSVKRLIGRPFSTPEVAEAVKRFEFSLVEGPKESVQVEARGQRYSLPEISAFILRRAKAVAEAALGETVDKAVITVPANFNELQRASTKVAGRLAGLDVLRILNEPTAAALAYGQQVKDAERIAIYDLGGGTFDITILDISGQVFEVLATAGDSQLGGDDADLALAERISLEYMKKFRYDPRPDPLMFGRLRVVAEQFKKDLGTRDVIEPTIHDVGFGADGSALSLKVRLTRAELDDLVKPLADRTIAVTERALAAAGRSAHEISQVLLVGGSTRIPLISETVAKFFGREPTLQVNPDEVVALGAAIQANALARSSAPTRAVVQKSDGGPIRRETAPVISVAPSTLRRDDAPRSTAEPHKAGRAHATPEPTPRPPQDFRPTQPNMEAHRVEAPASTATPQAHAQKENSERPTPVAAPPSATGRSLAEAWGVKPAMPAEPHQAGRQISPAQPPRARPLSREEPDDVDDSWDAPGAQAPISTGYSSLPERPPVPRRENAPIAALALVKAEVEVPRAQPVVEAFDVARPVQMDFSDTTLIHRAPGFAPVALDDGRMLLATPATSTIDARPGNALLIDVTPLSLRVETAGGYSDVLIRANTPVPCDRSRVFLTARDNQTSVVVRVAQGEVPKFSENTFLGELILANLPAGARGDVRVEVTFELDADGILNVRAMELGSGMVAGATIRLLGVTQDAEELAAMQARQARAEVEG